MRDGRSVQRKRIKGRVTGREKEGILAGASEGQDSSTELPQDRKQAKDRKFNHSTGVFFSGISCLLICLFESPVFPL